jgi:hypothetical protein
MTAANLLYRRGHDGGHWLVACGLAGPLAFLFVADQARFVEPQATPTESPATRTTDGVTVIVPSSAIGWFHPDTHRWLDRLGQITVADTVPFEAAGTGAGAHDLADVRSVAAECFPRTPIDTVRLPGRVPDALAAWAADHKPAVILTAREAHSPATIARLARLAAAQPGVALVVTDHAAVPAKAA